MGKYIIRRIIEIFPTLIITSFLIFFVVKQMPGDPVSAYLGIGSNVSPEVQAQMREQLGLNASIFEQYIRWIGRIFTGNFGRSIAMRQPVTEFILPLIRNTFLLNFVSLIVALLVSVPVGIKQAVKKYSKFDNSITVVSLFGVSVPSFFFAFMLIFFVAIPFGLPLNGMRDAIAVARGNQNAIQVVLDVARHMILPVTVLAFGSFAGWTRYIRNAMIDVLNQDYIRTARSKGLKEKVVIYRHAFKNALIPLITLLGFQLPALFSGAVILESVFQWPGIGRALVSAISTQDQSVVLATLLFLSLMLMLGNLLADVFYSIADPRIKAN